MKIDIESLSSPNFRDRLTTPIVDNVRASIGVFTALEELRRRYLSGYHDVMVLGGSKGQGQDSSRVISDVTVFHNPISGNIISLSQIFDATDFCTGVLREQEKVVMGVGTIIGIVPDMYYILTRRVPGNLYFSVKNPHTPISASADLQNIRILTRYDRDEITGVSTLSLLPPS